MKQILTAFCLLMLGFSGSACAQDDGILKISEPYALATTSVQKHGAAFMKIVNISGNDLNITSAHSPVAERVELHTHKMDGGVMMMRQVESIMIPVDVLHRLEPAGDHIMLMGLKAPLKAGESFPLTLVTEAGEVVVDVPVKNPGDVD